jgi:hypothetical protein
LSPGLPGENDISQFDRASSSQEVTADFAWRNQSRLQKGLNLCSVLKLIIHPFLQYSQCYVTVGKMEREVRSFKRHMKVGKNGVGTYTFCIYNVSQ